MKLEQKTKTKKYSKVQMAILKTLSVAGLLTVAMVAPNALQLLKFVGDDKKKRYLQQSINHSRKRLFDKGLIFCDKFGFLQLTNLGEKELRRVENIDYKIKKPKRWDKKWRILIFDIKEKKRGLRDQLRITLNSIGFIKLQNSVWVYPYDCEDLINLLKANSSFDKEVLYIVADRIENEEKLLKSFNLRK